MPHTITKDGMLETIFYKFPDEAYAADLGDHTLRTAALQAKVKNKDSRATVFRFQP